MAFSEDRLKVGIGILAILGAGYLVTTRLFDDTSPKGTKFVAVKDPTKLATHEAARLTKHGLAPQAKPVVPETQKIATLQTGGIAPATGSAEFKATSVSASPPVISTREALARALRTAPRPMDRNQVFRMILEDLDEFEGSSFTYLHLRWERQFGPEAAEVLARIALDRNQRFQNRYIALLSAVKLGGNEIVESLLGLSDDPSPFIRYALALSLRFAAQPSRLKISYVLLEDPALIVREAAFEAVQSSPVSEIAPHLAVMIDDPNNYVRGKPLPIAVRAAKILEVSRRQAPLRAGVQLVSQSASGAR